MVIRRLVISALSLLISLSIAGDAGAISKRCELAERLYLQEDYRKASQECERLLKRYKRSDFADDLTLLAGLSYLKLKDYSKARQYFESLLNNYDDPILISEANIGLSQIPGSGPSVKEPSLFAIQIGSFSKKRNADRLYRKLKRRRYTVRVVKDKKDGKTVYKVKIGRFKSRSAAAKFAKRLKRTGYQTAIVGY